MPFERAAKFSELVDGDIRPVRLGNHDIIIVRDGESVRAFQRWCLHQRADLVEGIVSRGHLICALHGWRFALLDGALDIDPKTCLRRYVTDIRGDEVFVEVPDGGA